MKKYLLFVASLLATVPGFAQSVEDVSFISKDNVELTGKLYLPPNAVDVPLVVVMHGCAGMYSYSNPQNGVNLQTKDWSARLNNAGYAALFIDSFGGRTGVQNQCENGASSNSGVSEVTERPYDAYYGAFRVLRDYAPELDISKVFLMGWSHGGSSTLSAMSDAVSNEMFSTLFKAAYAVYPGCGLYGAFGGISTSTYTAYAPTHILHGSIDPLYTGGYCDHRVNNAQALGSQNLSLTVYLGAKHSFDSAKAVSSTWTQEDVDARTQEIEFIMSDLSALVN